jgi:hypothetical protein
VWTVYPSSLSSLLHEGSDIFGLSGSQSLVDQAILRLNGKIFVIIE